MTTRSVVPGATPQKAVIPAKAGIQYAAAFRFHHSEYWVTRSIQNSRATTAERVARLYSADTAPPLRGALPLPLAGGGLGWGLLRRALTRGEAPSPEAFGHSRGSPRRSSTRTAAEGGLCSPRTRGEVIPTDSNLQKAKAAQLRDLAARFARVLLGTFRPLQSEGVGNAGRPMHPQPRVRIVVVSMHTSIHSEPPEITRHSRTQWFTAYFALSPATGFLATVVTRINPQNLTPAPGRQDHTSSPSARSVLSSVAPSASIASRPAFVTIASAPVVGTRRQKI
jgi:hypothetical protein